MTTTARAITLPQVLPEPHYTGPNKHAAQYAISRSSGNVNLGFFCCCVMQLAVRAAAVVSVV
jgi:hypothetical protein